MIQWTINRERDQTVWNQHQNPGLETLKLSFVCRINKLRWSNKIMNVKNAFTFLKTVTLAGVHSLLSPPMSVALNVAMCSSFVAKDAVKPTKKLPFVFSNVYTALGSAFLRLIALNNLTVCQSFKLAAYYSVSFWLKGNLIFWNRLRLILSKSLQLLPCPSALESWQTVTNSTHNNICRIFVDRSSFHIISLSRQFLFPSLAFTITTPLPLHTSFLSCSSLIPYCIFYPCLKSLHCLLSVQLLSASGKIFMYLFTYFYFNDDLTKFSHGGSEYWCDVC